MITTESSSVERTKGPVQRMEVRAARKGGSGDAIAGFTAPPLLIQRLDHQLAVFDHAAVVVLLEGDVALLVGLFLIDVIDGRLVVDADDDVVPLGDDVLSEPLVVVSEVVGDLD